MRRAAAVVAALVLGACSDADPTRPSEHPHEAPGGARAVITAEADASGEAWTTGSLRDPAAGPDFPELLADAFTFRRPLPESGLNTPFDDGLLASLLVRICRVGDGACFAETVRFSSETGPGGEKIRLDSEDERYRVNWHSGDFDLEEGGTYRIVVEVAGLTVGFADVIPASDGRQVRDLTTDTEIGLLDGRTLPVAFSVGRHPVITAWRSRAGGAPASATALLLRDEHGQEADDAAAVLALVGYGPVGVAEAMRTAYGLSATRAATILLELGLVESAPGVVETLEGGGYELVEIAEVLKNAPFSLPAGEALETLLAAGFGLPGVAEALVEAYGESVEAAAALLRGAGLSVDEIGGWVLGRVGGDLTAALGILMEAGIAAPELGDWLVDGRGLTLVQAAVELETAGYGVSTLGDWILGRSPGDEPEAAALEVMKAAGFGAAEVGAWLRASLDTAAGEAATLLTGAGYPVSGVGDALADGYGLAPEAVAGLLRDAGHGLDAVGTWYADRLQAAGETAGKAQALTVTLLRSLGATAREAGDWLVARLGEPAWELAAGVLSEGGYLATEVVVWLEDRTGLGPETLAGFLEKAGYTAAQAADALLTGLGATAGEVAGILTDVYQVGISQVAVILTELGIPTPELGDALVFAYGVGLETAARILEFAGHTLGPIADWYANALEAGGETAERAVEFTVDLLRDLGATAEQAGEWAIRRIGSPALELVSGALAKAGYFATDVVAWLKSRTALPAEEIGALLRNAGYGAAQAAEALLDVLGLTRTEVVGVLWFVYGTAPAGAAEILDGLGATALEIARALSSAYPAGPQSVAFALANVGYGIVEIFDVLVEVFALGFDAAVDVLVSVGFDQGEVLTALGG